MCTVTAPGVNSGLRVPTVGHTEAPAWAGTGRRLWKALWRADCWLLQCTQRPWGLGRSSWAEDTLTSGIGQQL